MKLQIENGISTHNPDSMLAFAFGEWVQNHRYKFTGEYTDSATGPYFESSEWSGRDEAMTAIPKFIAAIRAGKYKWVELITSVKRKGRWKFQSREHVGRQS
jgi:hypothetical protein